jgi:hypothetical protein
MRAVSFRQLLILVVGFGFLVGVEAQTIPSAKLMALSHASAKHTEMMADCATLAGAVSSEQKKDPASAFRSAVPRSAFVRRPFRPRQLLLRPPLLGDSCPIGRAWPPRSPRYRSNLIFTPL